MASNNLRRTCAALALGTAMSVTAACGGDDSGSSDKTLRVIAINLGAAGDDNPMAILAKDFEKANPGVKVKFQLLDFDQYNQTARAQINAGSPPDVMQSSLGYGNATALAELGSIDAIEDLSDQPWVKDMPEQFKPVLGYDGKVQGFSPLFSTIGLVFNQQLFDDNGFTVPQDYNEVLQFCKDAKAKNLVPIALGAQAGVTILFPGYAIAASTAYAEDPDFPQKRLDDEETFSDNAGWVQAMEEFKQLNDEGCFGDAATGVSQEAANNQLANGEAASMVTIIDFLGQLKSLNPDADWQMAPFAANPDASLTRVPAGGTGAFAVPSKAKNVDLGKKFIAFLAERENAIKYAQGAGSIPLVTLNDPEPQLPAEVTQMAPFLTPDKSVTYIDQYWPSADVQAKYIAGIQGMLSGQDEPADVLKAMDEAWKPAS